jgi:hypothetical protein
MTRFERPILDIVGRCPLAEAAGQAGLCRDDTRAIGPGIRGSKNKQGGHKPRFHGSRPPENSFSTLMRKPECPVDCRIGNLLPDHTPRSALTFRPAAIIRRDLRGTPEHPNTQALRLWILHSLLMVSTT